ncbi:MAG: putative selenate ABC transporter substrate-binding protein [Chloroflexi bacterium]|nr:putative selenate ABC transporter substrate-binding protein [Chloroflexota bacterium]
MRKPFLLMLGLVAALAVTGACSGDEPQVSDSSQPAASRPSGSASAATLYIAGIPERNAAALARRYEALTEYLGGELGVNVEYIPTVDYAATVAGFEKNDIQLAWFGGLTGVQARIAVPDSEAIAQRPRDAEFHSKFIVQSQLDVDSLEDLKGLTFTFGSESSTSGHLMPRHFLLEAGIDPDTDFSGPPNFSGSHDTTWKLVETGAFQAGALDESVWEAALNSGAVDTTRVREFWTTPAYYDYNWTIRGDVDQTFGAGFKERVRQALLSIGSEQPEVLELFSTPEGFTETNNENYGDIESVARSLGIIR